MCLYWNNKNALFYYSFLFFFYYYFYLYLNVNFSSYSRLCSFFGFTKAYQDSRVLAHSEEGHGWAEDTAFSVKLIIALIDV